LFKILCLTCGVKTFLAETLLVSCTLLSGELNLAFRPEIRAPQTGNIRRGRGFSLQEIKDAGLSLTDARWMAIPIDGRRKTRHPENVKLIKNYLERIKKLEKATKTPKTKPKAGKAKPPKAKSISEPIETDLTNLSGITKKLAEALVEAGVKSIHDLAKTSPRRLARITDLKRNRAEKLIDTAKRYERERAKAAREEKVKEPTIKDLKDLPDITRSDVKQLKELGVESLDDLKTEDPRDLALITGIPESRIKEWRRTIRSLGKE
jgi:transcription termination factor NusA